MDEKTQRISDFSDRLARSILSEVVDDIKLAKIQEIKEQTESAKSSPRLSRGQISYRVHFFECEFSFRKNLTTQNVY